MATTVGLISLGCSKNRVDSEQMLAVLKEHGYQIVSDPSRAEVIIVNTCGFIQSAKEEAISTLFEMAGYKQTGCCLPAGGDGLFCPALSGSHSGGNARSGRHHGRERLSEARRGAPGSRKGRTPRLHRRRRPVPRVRTRADHAEVQRIRPHWRRLRQLVFLLRDSDDPRRVSQPPEGGLFWPR